MARSSDGETAARLVRAQATEYLLARMVGWRLNLGVVSGALVAAAAGCLDSPDAPSRAGISAALVVPRADSSLPCAVNDVLVRNCQRCHQNPPRFGAPMPLVTWDDTQRPAPSDPSKKVYEVIGARIHDADDPMPPSGPLGAADMQAIDAWVAAGAPSAPSDGPSGTCAAPDAGPPDTEPLPCTVDHSLAPTAPWPVASDRNDEYVCYGIDITTSSKRHATAIAPRVQNARVVHHMDLFQADESYGPNTQACSPFANQDWRMVYAWAPGGKNMILPAAAGFPLEGTTHYVVQIHYSNVAHVPGQTDASGIDMCTTDQLRANDADVMAFGTNHFTIPPRANYDLTCDYTIPAGTPDLHVFAVMPHMHNYGHVLANTLFPGGSGAPVGLGVQPNWNVNNQTWFDVGATVHAGDRISTRCQWANTSDSAVSFGDSSLDEMCYAFSMYYPRIASSSWSWAAPSAASICSPTQ